MFVSFSISLHLLGVMVILSCQDSRLMTADTQSSTSTSVKIT